MIILYIKNKLLKGEYDIEDDIEGKLIDLGYSISKYYLNKLSQIEYLIINKLEEDKDICFPIKSQEIQLKHFNKEFI